MMRRKPVSFALFATLLVAINLIQSQGFMFNISMLVPIQPTSSEVATQESDCRSDEIYVPAEQACYYGPKFMALTSMGLLAVKHFNERNPAYVPEFGQLQGCDFNMSVKLFDTKFSSDAAVSNTIEYMQDKERELFDPNAVLGPATSAASIPTALINSALDIPQISYWATSTELNQAKYKRFMRTIPTDADVASSICDFWRQKGYKHAAVLFISDDYGEEYKEAVVDNCSPDINIITIPFISQDEANIKGQVEKLAKSDVRVFLLVSLTGSLQYVSKYGVELGLFDNAMWIISDGISSSDIDTLPAAEKEKFNGALRVSSAGGTETNPRWVAFRDQWDNIDFSELESVPVNWPPAWTPSLIAEVSPNTNEVKNVGTFMYDAIATYAVGVCNLLRKAQSSAQLPENFGADFLQSIGQVQFSGLTGPVKFESSTGNRNASTATYEMDNIVLGSDGAFTIRNVGYFTGGNWTLMEADTIYSGGSATLPDNVVVPEEDFSSSPTVKAVLYVMGSTNLILAGALFLWTLLHRDHIIIRASQLPFLATITIGVMISSSSVFLFTVDDTTDAVVPEDILVLSRAGEYSPASAACLSSIWLYSIGFTIAFGALFARIWRIRRLFLTRKTLRRVNIPNSLLFLIVGALLTIDVSILLAWAIVDPLKYERITVQQDKFDQPEVSSGQCTSDSPLQFILLLGIFHISVLIVGNYFAWNCRKINSTFVEVRQLGVAMWSYVQVIALGIPVLVIVSTSAETLMFVKGAIVFLNDMTLLLLLFVPKILGVHFDMYDTSGQGGEFFEGYRQKGSNESSSRGDAESQDSKMPHPSMTMTFVPSALSSSQADPPSMVGFRNGSGVKGL